MEVLTLEKAKEMLKSGKITEEDKQKLLENLKIRKKTLEKTMFEIRQEKNIARFAALCQKFLFDYEDYLHFKEVCWHAGIKL